MDPNESLDYPNLANFRGGPAILQTMRMKQDRDALPPWLVTTPWQRGQSTHVDDDVDEARSSGGFCLSPRYEARWRADEIMAALEMETPPWLICDAATSPLSPRCSHATNQWIDDVNEPEDVRAPHFCNTCGALHRGPVCRCMQLTIAHPITRILNKIACELAAVTPPASPPVTERWEMSPNPSEAPLTDESSTQPQALCC